MRCAWCGSGFDRPAERNPRKFCSRPCQRAEANHRAKLERAIGFAPVMAQSCRCPGGPLTDSSDLDGDDRCLRCGHYPRRAFDPFPIQPLTEGGGVGR